MGVKVLRGEFVGDLQLEGMAPRPTPYISDSLETRDIRSADSELPRGHAVSSRGSLCPSHLRRV